MASGRDRENTKSPALDPARLEHGKHCIRQVDGEREPVLCPLARDNPKPFGFVDLIVSHPGNFSAEHRSKAVIGRAAQNRPKAVAAFPENADLAVVQCAHAAGFFGFLDRDRRHGDEVALIGCPVEESRQTTIVLFRASGPRC